MSASHSPQPIPPQGPPEGQAGLGDDRYLRLFECLTPLFHTHDIEIILDQACQIIAEMLEVQACSIMLEAREPGMLRLGGATHIPREEWKSIRVPIEGTALGRVYDSAESLLINGAEAFRRFFGREPERRYKTPSCVMTPLPMHSRVAGVVNIAHPHDQRLLDQRDVDLIAAVSRLVGGALGSAMAFSETRGMQRNLEDILDSLQVGVLALTTRNEVVHMNQRAREMMGKTIGPGDLPDLAEFLPTKVHGVCRTLFQESLKHRELRQERIKARFEGRTMPVLVTACPIRSLGMSLPAGILMFENVERDEELKRLQESENMKKNFLAMISHELRTPLAVIRGALPLIDPSRSETVEADTLRQVHDLLLKNCNRLGGLVNSILDVTEIDNGTLELRISPLDPHLLIEEIIDLQAETATQKRLTWDTRLMENPPTLLADHKRLRQVLAELVANAVKFSEPRGAITLETAMHDEWFELRLTNRGAPIDPDVRNTIFEKFYQCDQSSTRAAGGLGLGLFLVRNILRLHGGDIDLETAEEHKTTFLVRLPVGVGDPQEGAAPQTP